MQTQEPSWSGFVQQIKAEKRALLILLSSSALLVVAWYPGYYTSILGMMTEAQRQSPAHLWWAHAGQFFIALLLLVLVPVALIKWVLREPLREYGVCLGDWRFALKYLACACVLLAPGLYLTGADPAFYREYPLIRQLYGQGSWTTMVAWEMTYLLYYIAWEFHFRGYQQFGMEKRVGPILAILFQLLASTFIHMRKPFGETFSAIAGAFLIGYLAWRSRSVLWGILLHWYIGASTDFWSYYHWKQAGFPK